MAVKNFSSRVQICGRSAGCHGGHNAVEQSAYISRETMYCEYDGKTYSPKYSEDLVHTEVLLPENAPKEYADPKVLWNAVEMAEKSNNAQTARTVRMELPNNWSYELATEVVRALCEREFVKKGMCVQFAIHDSVNKKTGQRNLHVHILLTMRGIDENGKWMPKQKKVYLTDEKGERIPLIDKATGQQKVDKQNRRQWKCKSVPTNDWNSKENARQWRKDFVDTINAVNERMGMTDYFWEYRSFKEQGLEIKPQIHLGEKASAMERAGIHTIRGDINRDIIARNAIVLKAQAALEQAKKELEEIKASPVKVVTAIRNEILDMIREIAKRNSNRLNLPVIKGEYLKKINDRSVLQKKDWMESFVHDMGWTTFAEMNADREKLKQSYDDLLTDRTVKADRINYLSTLLDKYEDYKPYIKYHKEQWAVTGWVRKRYERSHIAELEYYDMYRDELKGMIKEPDKKISPVSWKKELEKLKPEYDKTQKPYSQLVWKLAAIEVLNYNRKDLERMLESERHQQVRQISRSAKRENALE